MRIPRNVEAIKRVQQAEFSGQSLIERKHLYMEQNAFAIDLDVPIYRIFQLKYLQSDVEADRLTQIRANPDSWGDDYENPLLRASFPDCVTGGTIDLGGVVNDFYALSWTKTSIETESAWSKFSHGNPAVRIGTTPRLLLDRLMDTEDQWFMLRHYIGSVCYKEQEEIDQWISNQDYSVHLDPLGHNLARSLMLLRSFLNNEEEVRLLFSLLKNSPNKWSEENVKATEEICSMPFRWDGVIKSVVFGSLVSDNEKEEFNRLLSSKNINLPPSRSAI